MKQEILAKVQETLSGALGVPLSEIQTESSLTRDLGAESIDFIDIIFRLEKSFEIKIPSGELFPANLLNDERFVKDGLVTAAGQSELRTKYPYLDLGEFSKDPKIGKLAEQFTVKMIADYVDRKLQEKAKA